MFVGLLWETSQWRKNGEKMAKNGEIQALSKNDEIQAPIPFTLFSGHRLIIAIFCIFLAKNWPKNGEKWRNSGAVSFYTLF